MLDVVSVGVVALECVEVLRLTVANRRHGLVGRVAFRLVALFKNGL